MSLHTPTISHLWNLGYDYEGNKREMSSNIPVSAFTCKSNEGIQNRLLSNVDIMDSDKSMTAIALWDTGATGTCISYEVVKHLGLKPTGKKNIQTPSGKKEVFTYLVSVTLPNDVVIPDVEVCDSTIGDQGIGMLIGMDIITRGDFAVSNYEGKTVYSFRVPSITITDYVLQHRIKDKIGTHGKGKRKSKRK